MNKEFIPYEEALALKELGFDEPCIAFYEPNNEKVMIVGVPQKYNNPTLLRLKDFCAPTYSQAFRWFREKYDLFGVVEGKGYDHKKYYIYSINGKWHPSQPGFDNYEEAELACLKKLIEITKNK